MRFIDFFRKEKAFLLQQALEDMKGMLEIAHDMFVTASAFLLENEVLEADLEAQDDVVNKKEQTIRQAVLDHFSIQPDPNVVFGLILVSIVQDVERIGDLSKSMVSMRQMAQRPLMGPSVQPLRDLRDDVAKIFEKTRCGFVETDVHLARSVMENHRTCKARLADYIIWLAQRQEVSANEALVLGISARKISRVSSHLSNIASSVALPFDQIRRPPTWIHSEV